MNGLFDLKRLTLLLLCVCSILCLSACGQPDEGTPPTQTEGSVSVTSAPVAGTSAEVATTATEAKYCELVLDQDEWSAGVTEITGKLVATRPGEILMAENHYILDKVEGDTLTRVGLIQYDIGIESPQPESDQYASINFSVVIAHITDGKETGLAPGTYQISYVYCGKTVDTQTFEVK